MFTSFVAPHPTRDPRRVLSAPDHSVQNGRAPNALVARQDLQGTKTQIAKALGILDLPIEVEDQADPWVVVASQLIWLGAVEIDEIQTTPGTDLAAALSHLHAIAGASKLPYTRREAAIATLLPMWFEEIVMKDGAKASNRD